MRDDDVARLVRLAGTSGSIAAPGEDRVARVRAAVKDAWRDEFAARQVKTRRRWFTVAALAAAASVAIAFAVYRPFRQPATATAPIIVAHIDQITWQATGSAPFTAGAAVMSGSIVTTSKGTLAMTMTNGVHLRMDAASTARVDSATDVALERGALYVDSGGAQSKQPGAAAISIHTPSGLVRDIGTRFEVRLTGAGMRVRVRDGRVQVTLSSGEEARASAGEELLSKPDGSMSRRAIAVTGSQWAWAERAGPPFSVEGKTLGALLDWVSREGAWDVTFADSGFAATARAIVVHGRPDLLKGLTPAEALEVVLQTCGLRHRIDGNRVVIEK